MHPQPRGATRPRFASFPSIAKLPSDNRERREGRVPAAPATQLGINIVGRNGESLLRRLAHLNWPRLVGDKFTLRPVWSHGGPALF
jgi:hypothetical protein